jgi:uncharacterized DUF497 family protein
MLYKNSKQDKDSVLFASRHEKDSQAAHFNRMIFGNSGSLYKEESRMKINEFTWPKDRIDHIARHGVTPGEVEEACFGPAFVQRAQSQGENPVYYVLGQTEAGSYLFCVVIQFPDGKGYPITARPMTGKEKRRYKQWRKQ